MITNIQTISNIEAVLPVLHNCQLLTSDISESAPPIFFGAQIDKSLVGVVGVEIFQNFALLRSLAVIESHRGCGIAKQLVTHAEHAAIAQGINKLFLLTTSAPTLFSKLGFIIASRSEAPPAIRATPQFSSLCQSSSSFMCKVIGGSPNGAHN